MLHSQRRVVALLMLALAFGAVGCAGMPASRVSSTQPQSSSETWQPQSASTLRVSLPGGKPCSKATPTPDTYISTAFAPTEYKTRGAPHLRCVEP